MKHTQGPWKASRRAVYASSEWRAGENVKGECKTLLLDLNPSIPEEETEANARLIASAPELLSAMQDLVFQFRVANTPEDVEFIDAARLASTALTGG